MKGRCSLLTSKWKLEAGVQSWSCDKKSVAASAVGMEASSRRIKACVPMSVEDEQKRWEIQRKSDIGRNKWCLGTWYAVIETIARWNISIGSCCECVNASKKSHMGRRPRHKRDTLSWRGCVEGISRVLQGLEINCGGMDWWYRWLLGGCMLIVIQMGFCVAAVAISWLTWHQWRSSWKGTRMGIFPGYSL